jgi:hypothetical protein
MAHSLCCVAPSTDDHTKAISGSPRFMLMWKCSLTPLIELGPGRPLCPPRAKPGPFYSCSLLGRGRHHEGNAGNYCSWHIGAHDEWRKCLQIECERQSSVSKSGSGNLCEPVVLLVENDPQGAQGQALRPRRSSLSRRASLSNGAPVPDTPGPGPLRAWGMGGVAWPALLHRLCQRSTWRSVSR